jgi:microcystin-dependent protein
MAEPFIGQIIPVGFNFAPRYYATCDGQMLSVAQYSALFSLLGTTFGGNGTTIFGLPDLRGRTPIHQGQGPGLPNFVMGQSSGEETHTLISTEMPMHNHLVNAVGNTNSASTTPIGHLPGVDSSELASPYSTSTNGTIMSASSIGITGSSIPHQNEQPYLTICYCIALAGIYPQRS